MPVFLSSLHFTHLLLFCSKRDDSHKKCKTRESICLFQDTFFLGILINLIHAPLSLVSAKTPGKFLFYFIVERDVIKVCGWRSSRDQKRQDKTKLEHLVKEK